MLRPLTLTLYVSELPWLVNVAVPEGLVPLSVGGGTSFAASSRAWNFSGLDLSELDCVAGAEAQDKSAREIHGKASLFIGPPELGRSSLYWREPSHKSGRGGRIRDEPPGGVTLR